MGALAVRFVSNEAGEWGVLIELRERVDARLRAQ